MILLLSLILLPAGEPWVRKGEPSTPRNVEVAVVTAVLLDVMRLVALESIESELRLD